MPHRYFSKEFAHGMAWLSEADSRHLCVVMRAQAGQAVTVCDGHGTDYACRLAVVSPARAGLDILSSEKSVSEPSVRVILYVGYPKQDKLEHVIQKATELGAARIVPFFSRFCVAAPKNEEKKHERYARIAFEAAKQAGRGAVPEVGLPLTYKQMLAEAAGADTALFCYEKAARPYIAGWLVEAPSPSSPVARAAFPPRRRRPPKPRAFCLWALGRAFSAARQRPLLRWLSRWH